MFYLVNVYALVVLLVAVPLISGWLVCYASLTGGRFVVRLCRVTSAKLNYVVHRLKLESHP
jgi:hypothetical protein